jgi:hypothetical protein
MLFLLAPHEAPMSLKILLMIFARAPAGLFKGEFKLDERTVVRGWPARVLGFLLLFLASMLLVNGLVLRAFGQDVFSDIYLLACFLTFLGSIVTAAVLTAIYSKKKKVRTPQESAESPSADAPMTKRPWQK